jgi:acyl-CoA dehydrogenase
MIGGASTDLELRLEDRHHTLAERAAAFVAEHVAPHEDDDSDAFARRITAALGQAGLLDACVDLDVRGICVVREACARSSGLVDSMVALQGLGYAPIELAGAEAHQARWREAVRTGAAIPAFAITEPEAGSDVANLRTTATRDGDGWVLSGEKHFITNAGIADFYTVFARTSDDGSRGITAFCVPADRVSAVERFELVAPHPCGAIRLDGVRLGDEARVGELGQGFKLAMATLDRFRCTVGAAALGMAGRALDEAIGRARSREQFGQPILRFQQVEAMIAESWTELWASRLLVYKAAAARDAGDPAAGPYASAAKLFATEAAQRIIDRAVQIHGGLGVRRGTAVERLYREIRALRIYEGTSEIQRVVIGRAVTR